MQMNRWAVVLTGSVVWMAVVCVGWANGFRNPPESATGLGALGARMTAVTDASAWSYNPANAAETAEPSVMASLLLVSGRSKFEAPDGRRGQTTEPESLLPNIHAAWPLERGGTVGLAVTTPYGQSTVWHADGPFQYVSPHRAEMTTISVAPGVAWPLNDQLAIGATANLYWSELELRQRVPWAMQTGVPGLPDGETRLKGDGLGIGASVGLTWDATARQRVALVYKAPFSIDYEGNTRISQVPPPLAGMVAARSDFDSTIKFPTIISAGYGLQLRDDVRLGIDVEWLDFSRFSELPLDVGINNPTGLVPPTVPQDWKDTWTLGFGVEWDCDEQWTLRTGYLFMETPIPSTTMAPTLPDADRHVVSVGVGYTWGAHQLDAAYAYNIFRDRDVRNQMQPAYSGTYELASQLVQVSYRRMF